MNIINCCIECINRGSCQLANKEELQKMGIFGCDNNQEYVYIGVFPSKDIPLKVVRDNNYTNKGE